MVDIFYIIVWSRSKIPILLRESDHFPQCTNWGLHEPEPMFSTPAHPKSRLQASGQATPATSSRRRQGLGGPAHRLSRSGRRPSLLPLFFFVCVFFKQLSACKDICSSASNSHPHPASLGWSQRNDLRCPLFVAELLCKPRLSLVFGRCFGFKHGRRRIFFEQVCWEKSAVHCQNDYN